MSIERWRPSVTVAAIVADDAGRYLLVEEHTPEGLRLNNPAGHLDPGETPLQGVVRETLEETARVLTPEALVGVYMARFTRPAAPGRAAEDITYLRFAYCGAVGEAIAGRALDTPIVRTLWLEPEQIEARRDAWRSELVGRCIADHRAGRRFPLELVHADGSLVQPRVLG
ncbi:MAG: NUDIX hydrolase [Burkholderiales bacterium]|nr:NUDIX hydrolase [Burkholderiales bacterium]